MLGIKGQLYSKEILDRSDLLIFLGCRAAPTVYLDSAKNNKKLKKIIVDIDTQSLNHPLTNFDLKVNYDLKDFFKSFSKLNNPKISFKNWNTFSKKNKQQN